MVSDQGRGGLGSRRWKKRLLGLIVVAGLGTALYWGYWFTLGDRFTAICSEHGVFHSAAPRSAALTRIVEHHNIRSVVDLRSSPRGLMPADEGRLLENIGRVTTTCPPLKYRRSRPWTGFSSSASTLITFPC